MEKNRDAIEEGNGENNEWRVNYRRDVQGRKERRSTSIQSRVELSKKV